MKLKIAIVGIGYVGLSNAMLLSLIKTTNADLIVIDGKSVHYSFMIKDRKRHYIPLPHEVSNIN